MKRLMAAAAALAAGAGAVLGAADQHGTAIFHGVELVYEVVDGLAVHAGDMILGTANEAAAARRLADADRLRHAVPPCCAEILWPQGVVPYVIDDDVPRTEWILEAMGIWNAQTVVEFVERTTERDYLRFAVRDTGCFGVLGRGFDGGERIIPIVPGGCNVPTTLHELGHAIGLGHEHQRKDRHRYVRVFPENISPVWGADQWQPTSWDGDPIGPYDYRSVMHYGFSSDDLRRHGAIRMAETIPPGMPMGQTVELSPGDVDSVARIYGQQPAAYVVSTNPAGLEVIVDGARVTAPAAFRWRPESTHTLEVPSPQFRPGSRFLFGRWSDNGEQAHTITVDRGTTLYQASFIAQHQVATSVSPPGAGSVEIAPASPDGFYTLRTPVEVSAHPFPPFRFLDWQTETDYYWSSILSRMHGASSNPARASVSAGMVYRASFIDGPIFRIESNVDAVPVAVNGREHQAPVAFAPSRLPASTTVKAIPIEDVRRSYRHRFRGWSNGGEIKHSIEIPQDADSTLTLTLDTEHQLSTAAWYGHEVLTTPSLPEDGFYREGTEVRLLAVEKPPEEFIGWSGDVSGTDPAALAVMDTARHVEAVFAAGTRDIRVEQPVAVSLRWNPDGSDYERLYVRPPAVASNLTIEFRTRARTNGGAAGLFVTHQRDPWPWDVHHEDADRVLRGGSVQMPILRPASGWPAAYFILIRSAESGGAGTRTLEGTLVVR